MWKSTCCLTPATPSRDHQFRMTCAREPAVVPGREGTRSGGFPAGGVQESTNPLDSGGSGTGGALHAVEGEQAQPEHGDQALDVVPPVRQGAGEVDVRGPVGWQRFDAGADAVDDGEELPVQLLGPFGGVEVDP